MTKYPPIDLEPYKSGKRKMMMKCWHEECENEIDITKDYISAETQNNLRKTSPKYNPGCDELVIYGRECEKH